MTLSPICCIYLNLNPTDWTETGVRLVGTTMIMYGKLCMQKNITGPLHCSDLLSTLAQPPPVQNEGVVDTVLLVIYLSTS